GPRGGWPSGRLSGLLLVDGRAHAADPGRSRFGPGRTSGRTLGRRRGRPRGSGCTVFVIVGGSVMLGGTLQETGEKKPGHHGSAEEQRRIAAREPCDVFDQLAEVAVADRFREILE